MYPLRVGEGAVLPIRALPAKQSSKGFWIFGHVVPPERRLTSLSPKQGSGRSTKGSLIGWLSSTVVKEMLWLAHLVSQSNARFNFSIHVAQATSLAPPKPETEFDQI
ncbi:hypothetical protein LNV08_22105 [Paucibacter sp. TC2R-5]|uniref:hypothetical protein n=1 Tax=Paucibacter sp. TC2R-5 TaxID=2893555 RepID=UPI0021E4ABE4|nr:hypothetical protein [Paucibacter sp. TC2R-5]MCV2361668.1 hypothetical protein [Paucibacter sp. TC2R-5]